MEFSKPKTTTTRTKKTALATSSATDSVRLNRAKVTKAPATMVSMISRKKIRPMLKLPAICSPQVSFSIRPLRLMPSTGPTSSTTRTGMTRKVAKPQAMPISELAMRPNAPRSESQRKMSPTVADIIA